MKKVIVYLSLIIGLGACDNENLAELVVAEESSNAMEEVPSGMVKFREELIPRGDYEAMILKRIDVKNADIDLTPTNQMESIPADAKPNMPDFLKQIPYLDTVSIINTEDSILQGGDVQTEGVPFLEIDEKRGAYRITESTKPKRDLEDVFSEDEWWKKTTEYFKNLGIDETQTRDRWITEMVSYEASDDDKEPVKHHLQKVIYVYREVNGLKVLDERMIFQFHRTGEPWTISGQWRQIDYEKSNLSSSLTSTDDALDKIVDHLAELNVNPYFEEKITVNTAYELSPIGDGPMHVLNPVAIVMVPKDKGVPGTYKPEVTRVPL